MSKTRKATSMDGIHNEMMKTSKSFRESTPRSRETRVKRIHTLRMKKDDWFPDYGDSFAKVKKKHRSEKYGSCKKYKVTAGRIIVCKDTGKEVFSIDKEEGFSPTEADAMARYIVDLLNKKKDFQKFYKKHIK